MPWIAALIALLVAGCAATKKAGGPVREVYAADTVGFWRQVRAFQLANGSSYQDLIDSTHRRSRYTLLFCRYRLVGEAQKPAAAELALRWLLAEPTAPDQASLLHQVRLMGGSLEVLAEPDYVGLELSLPHGSALPSIERMLSHLSAPRWDAKLFFAARDEMAAQRVLSVNDPDARRLRQTYSYFWPLHPYGKTHVGTYEELMNLKPDEVKAAFRRLWFDCPKAHAFSAGVTPQFDSLYPILERVPHRQVAQYPFPELLPMPETFVIERDTARLPMLFGLARPLASGDEVDDVLVAFWAYVMERRMEQDLCQKRHLTCDISWTLHEGPQPYALLRLAAPVPNTTLDRTLTLLKDMAQAEGIGADHFERLKRDFLFQWHLLHSSPESRHRAIADAAGRESVTQWLATPERVAQLSRSDFARFHQDLVSNFVWLYFGKASDLKGQLPAEFQALKSR